MNFNYFLFVIFSISAIVSAIMVINLSNAVHSVLFLVLTFCNVTLLLLLLGAEFFSFLLIIVYVGAIAVLFLFVIMMLNIKSNNKSYNLLYLLPLSILFCLFLFDYFFRFTLQFSNLNFSFYSINLWIEEINYISNTVSIGKVLYTYFGVLFLIASLVLLVAMIGVIVLTMHQKINLKQQQIGVQTLRNPVKVIKFLKLR